MAQQEMPAVAATEPGEKGATADDIDREWLQEMSK